MGFKLMTNFDRPYCSRSIGEFWRRWHISLSTWFKDYVYVSLGGNRVSEWRMYLNVAITFLVSGVWHGANWTFVLWGALNGLYLIIETATKKLRQNLLRMLGFSEEAWWVRIGQVCATFVLISLGWVLFRAKDISDAGYVLTRLFPSLRVGSVTAGIPGFGFGGLVLAIAGIILLEIIQSVRRREELLARMPTYRRWMVYYGFAFVILFFGVYDKTQFIYFQF